MKARSYRRLTNSLAVVAIAAALSYDHLNAFQPIALAIGSVSAVIAAIAYFRFHWSRVREQDCRAEAADAAEIPPTRTAPAEKSRTPHAIDVKGKHSVADADRALASSNVSFVPRRFDPRELGALLTEMEKNHWDCSLRAEPPGKEFALNVIIQNGIVRIVPTIKGGLAPRHKQPLSETPLINAG